GLGGIVSAEDALEFILVGASAIQVGTANFMDPGSAFNLVADLPDACRRCNVTSLDGLRGSLNA
ncbi:MAG: dihydroorotate dehydrogenase, partial [Desulfovibrionaceae bacterium]|nr:dihydroorotate dehydrogenase [Desulfovibrionaceae bacterium]